MACSSPAGGHRLLARPWRVGDISIVSLSCVLAAGALAAREAHAL